MKKIILLALVIIGYNTSVAQVYQTQDGLTVTLKKVKNVRDKGGLNSYVKVKDKSLDKILVRCHIDANDNEAVDVNSFALVDQENKLRYRVVDFVNYKGFSAMKSSGKLSRKLLKTPFTRETPYEYNLGAAYNPDVKDTFPDYNMGGFQNMETKLSLGPIRNPHESYVYYSPAEMDQFTAEFFYAVSKENSSPTFDLYYKGEKLFEIGMP